ncbi:hypothetical protein PMAYCL1PPCAC_31517, partial [Pristionchus mayeri]
RMAQQRRRNSAFDDIWQQLEGGLGHIYRKEPMVPTMYMGLYTHVYNFCTTVSPLTGTPILPARNLIRMTVQKETTDFVGTELYNNLAAFIKDHVEVILKESKRRSGEEQLKYFTVQWDLFRFCSKVVNGIFAYLNRHWIKRELEN